MPWDVIDVDREPDLSEYSQGKLDKLLYLAAIKADIDTVYNLLEAGANPETYTDDYSAITKGPALHVAAFKGHTQLAEYLIDYDADIHARDDYGYTPLHVACYNGRLELVQFLLDKDTDIVGDESGYSWINDKDLTGFENPWEEYFDESSGKPFWSHKVTDEAIWDQSEIPEDDLDPSPRQGYTPLHRATMNAHWDVIELLLSYGADLWAVDNLDRGVVHHACILGNLSVATALIKAGEPSKKKGRGEKKERQGAAAAAAAQKSKANPDFFRPDKHGYTLLHLAAQQGRKDVVDMLVKYGNKLHSTKHIQVKDENGRTPLDLARMGKKSACVETLEAWRFIIQKEVAAEKAKKTKLVMTGQ